MIEIEPREVWGARPPTDIHGLHGAKGRAIAHWPGAARNGRSDEEWLRNIQDFHMDQKDPPWWDIGYNHAALQDGRLVDGRGFGVRGGHTKSLNHLSYGLVVLQGTDEPEPTVNQLNAVANWLSIGQRDGYLTDDVVVSGHRDHKTTECPGDVLYRYVQVLNEEGWDVLDAPPDDPDDPFEGLDPALVEYYQQVLGHDPGGFAWTWQEKINSEELTMDQVRMRLLGSHLRRHGL